MDPWYAPTSLQWPVPGQWPVPASVQEPAPGWNPGYTAQFKDFSMFVSQLSGAINDEASAVEFYGALEGYAPSDYRDFVSHAKRDEVIHFRLLSRLYRRLTGYQPSVRVKSTQFSSYTEGLEIAFRNELEAAELYRDMYLSTKIAPVRDILFRTMTDEMEHAQRFNFLYTVALKA